MQLREVPVTPVPEGSDELDDEAEWIYKQAFCKPTISTQVKINCSTILFNTFMENMTCNLIYYTMLLLLILTYNALSIKNNCGKLKISRFYI